MSPVSLPGALEVNNDTQQQLGLTAVDSLNPSQEVRSMLSFGTSASSLKFTSLIREDDSKRLGCFTEGTKVTKGIVAGSSKKICKLIH